MDYKLKRLLWFNIGLVILILLNMILYNQNLNDNFKIYVWNVIYLEILMLLTIIWDFRTNEEKLQDEYDAMLERTKIGMIE